MTALILKDTFVLWKQMKIFLLLVLVLSALPSSFNQSFAVLYAAMLPYTAMAYDERSKWGQLADMMPFTDRDVVLGKFLLGWIASLLAAGISLVFQAVLSIFLESADMASISLLLLSVCASMCILSITLPLMFRFGVERGRLAMFLLIFLVCSAAGAMSTIARGTGSLEAVPPQLIAIFPLAALVLTAISVPLSIRLYRARKG